MLLAAVLVLLAGCDGGTAATTPSAARPITPSPGSSAEASAPLGTPAATASAPAATRSSALRIDPTLLDLLPREVDGHEVAESPEVEAADAADPTIPREVDALAAAFVHDDALNNWAVATVVQLRPGVLSDGFYASWRRTWDEGACEPAGGVTGSASSTIGGRPVEIGRCAGGVNTYHVRLGGDRLVSITAFGDGRYGEQLLANLTEKPG